MASRTLIYNGRIIAETHFIEPGYVLIDGQRIASVGNDWSAVEADARIDAQGQYISPGFIDMHTHGLRDIDFMESDHETTVRGLRAYASFGVTRVVASTLSNPIDNIVSQAKRLRAAKDDPDVGDILHGVHVEGPWLAPRCRGGHALEYLKHPQPDDVNRLIGEAGDVVRTVTFAPELPNSVWLTEELTRNGIVPVLGHTEASFEHAEAVILAGARHVTHMYDTTLGYGENPDEALVMMPGMETAVLLHDDVSIELIGCPVHVPPPFFRLINKIKPRDKKIVVSDSLVGTGQPDGTVLQYKDGHEVYVEDGVLRMIDDDPNVHGNLTGSAVTMNVALRRLCDYADLAVHEAVRWGSANPATTLGIQHETGSVRIGKYADLVLMDDDFQIKKTFVKGREVYSA
jgi:N-acetylglucosamine-6-phosphate deacetylase